MHELGGVTNYKEEEEEPSGFVCVLLGIYAL